MLFCANFSIYHLGNQNKPDKYFINIHIDYQYGSVSMSPQSITYNKINVDQYSALNIINSKPIMQNDAFSIFLILYKSFLSWDLILIISDDSR